MVATSRSAAADETDEERVFRGDLVRTLPHLRAFARGLCGRPDLADDLVQETAIKAWAARDRFTPGTNFRAWTFAILRNHYLSELRRNRHQVDYDPDAAERLLVMEADQEAPLHLNDMEAALQKLSPERRESILLIGAGGFTYEDAAAVCECAIGTMKSRVARARTELANMLDPEGASANGGKGERAAAASF
jgi:RNA polymerase sigma-70 factor (ECF subfamily)